MIDYQPQWNRGSWQQDDRSGGHRRTDGALRGQRIGRSPRSTAITGRVGCARSQIRTVLLNSLLIWYLLLISFLWFDFNRSVQQLPIWSNKSCRDSHSKEQLTHETFSSTRNETHCFLTRSSSTQQDRWLPCKPGSSAPAISTTSRWVTWQGHQANGRAGNTTCAFVNVDVEMLDSSSTFYLLLTSTSTWVYLDSQSLVV